MQKQSLMKGSVVLLVSAVLTKLLGALFKLPLAALLGGTGMGYFGSAYGLFLPVYAFSVSGMSAAVAALTAAAAARGEYRTVRRLRRLALLWFTLIGLAGTGLLLFGAEPFCRLAVKNPAAALPVAVLAPSVLLGCVSAVYRGYYEGLRCMNPTAVSQLAESAARFVCGLWFCRLVLENPDAVLRCLPPGTDLLAAAAAAAVCGVTVSTLAGTLLLVGIDRLCGDGISRACLANAPPAPERRTLLRQLFAILLPVALGSLVTNLTSVIDLATCMRGLAAAVCRAPERFSAYDMGSDAETANFLFGCFTGLSVTVFNLVPSVTNMLGKTALPAIAAARARGDRAALCRDSATVLHTTALLAIPAGLGLAALARPVLLFLFPGRPVEVAAATPSLVWLGLGVGALCLSCTVFSMLQAIGRARRPVELMLLGVAVKLAGNLLLVPLPSLHIAGAGLSTTLCYLVLAAAALRCYQKEADIRLPLLQILLPPAYAGLLCAMTAVLAQSLLAAPLGRLSLPVGILCGGGVYLLVLRVLRGNRRCVCCAADKQNAP